ARQRGRMGYTGADDCVKLGVLAANAAGSTVARSIELRSEVGGTVQSPQPQANNLTTGVWWLRLKKEGDTYSGSYSADGETWTELPAAVRNSAVATDAKVGVYTIGTNQSASKKVTFDYFRLAKAAAEDTTAPVTTAT